MLATDPENLDYLKDIINKHMDFDCSQYSDTFLQRRIEVRLRSIRITSFQDYSGILIRDETERKLLLSELTINVTNFFRDKEMWGTFMSDVIPHILSEKSKKHDRGIRIWSAGCSSGEEPLSIAICLREVLGKDADSNKIEILATDIKEEILSSAREAVYEQMQFKEMNELSLEYMKKYFTETENSRFKANDEIRSLVSYSRGDILKDSMPGNIDIVFCRNTVIYFNKEAKSELYLKIFNGLNKPGFFIMGKTEMLQGDARDCFRVFSAKERIYLKEPEGIT